MSDRELDRQTERLKTLRLELEKGIGRLVLSTRALRLTFSVYLLAALAVFGAMFSKGPGDLSLGPISLGYYRLFERDWTGVELLILGGLLYCLICVLRGEAKSQR